MILGFKLRFPDGSLTNFPAKILTGLNIPVAGHPYTPKLHSIREGQRWKEGIRIDFATGVRSKNYSCFAKSPVKSVQRIDILHRGPDCVIIFIDKKIFFSRSTKENASFVRDEALNVTGLGKEYIQNINFFEYGGLNFQTLWQNDGFDNEDQFWAWFKKPLRNGQLIHFTDFKY